MNNQEANILESVDNNYYIELDKALRRLESNPDFKMVILDGYLKDKALSGVSLLGRHDIKKRGERPDVIEELVAISNLQEYFFTIRQLGGSALVDEELADERR